MDCNFSVSDYLAQQTVSTITHRLGHLFCVASEYANPNEDGPKNTMLWLPTFALRPAILRDGSWRLMQPAVVAEQTSKQPALLGKR